MKMNIPRFNFCLSQKGLLVGLLILGLLFVFMFIRLAWTDGDEGRYLLLAQAVAQLDGQVDIYLPQPVEEWLTPSGYLYYLAAWIKCVGTKIALLRLSSVVPMVGFVLVFGCFVSNRVRENRLIQMAVLSLGALGVTVLNFSWVLLSESLFMFVLYLSFWSECRLQSPKGNLYTIFLGACSAAAMLIRPVGLALILAGLLFFVCHRMWKKLLIFCVAVMLAYLPEMVRVWRLTGYPLAYMMHYQAEDGGASTGILAMIPDVLQGFFGYFFHYLPRSMFFSLFDNDCLFCKIHASFLIVPVVVSIACLIVCGFFCHLRRCSISELFWIIYWPLICSYNKGSELAISGFHYQPRYLVPIIPLAALYFITGVKVVIRVICRHQILRVRLMNGVALCCCIYILLTSFIAGCIRVRAEWSLRGLSCWDPVRIEASGEVEFSRYIQALEWMRDHLPHNAVIASRKPRHTYLFSHRKGFRYDMDWLGDTRDVWDNIMEYLQYGPVYILQDAYPETSGYGRTRIHSLDPVIHGHKNELTLVYSTKEPVTRVWQYTGVQ